jgi:hypothetical protein
VQGPAVTDLTKAREQRADASREVGRLAVEGGVEERGIRAAAAAPSDSAHCQLQWQAPGSLGSVTTGVIEDTSYEEHRGFGQGF